ncbi:uncharacterized protein LOC123008490 [Tribolium madens]|uniref:uncharacterized protein LOC123008490 n=1 Tax=Tribolium madens TaxID=41895 RepID=UPI001CF751AC|nr:uncharacterized protein LOC123008490 [Tribolium madens]XP_044260250.1 uncharacterized protein LOC123008490 [Tribolium madens]XP_044260251.1 uncharacterized protein LOC123008490 [Tribolium madens]XP_044260252.1 uncharacterized protein LOC123008490 [Tribolium madens]
MKSTRLLLVFIILILVSVVHAKSNIFTLKNKTNIYCINEETEGSGVFVDPVAETSETLLLSKNNIKWLSDDWEVKNASSLNMVHVTDKRWNNFAIKSNFYFHYKLLSSVSVSLYAKEKTEIEIFVYNNEERKYYHTSVEDKQWYHFTVTTKNNYVNNMRNNEIIGKYDNVVPTDVVFRSRNGNVFLKEHLYNLRWSNKISERQPTTLTIPSNRISCLLLFISLCNECYLNITYQNLTTTINSNLLNQGESVMKWQVNKTVLNFEKDAEIHIRRGRYGRENFGYWILDYDICESPNMVSRHINSSEEKLTCKSLNQNKNTKRNVTTNNCQLSCQSLLGLNFPFCNDFTIGYNARWNCSWDSSENFCEIGCDIGTFELSSNSTYNKTHNKYPRSTNAKAETPRTTIIVIVVFLILFPSFFFIIIFAFIKWWSFILPKNLTHGVCSN